MTSVVDKYYRQISENIDNIKFHFNISSLLVKSKEHDSKIDKNETDISSNLSKIDKNETDISSNLSKIDKNETDISSNLSKIDKNETDISKINNDLLDLKDGYKLKDIIVFNMTNTNSQAVNKSNPIFIIFNDSIISFIKKDSFLQINTSVRMLFLLHYINIGYFDIILKIHDDKNQLISSTKLPLIGMISKQAILSNICYVKLTKDYNSINLQLSIQLQENQNRNDIIKILEYDNFVYVKIFEKLDNSIHYQEFDV